MSIKDAITAAAIVLWSLFNIIASLILIPLTFNRNITVAMARKVWAPGMLKIVGAEIEVEGKENVDFFKPHVFASNHLSHLDVAALFLSIPVNVYFIAKKELKKIPFVGWFITASGMIFIDRQNRKMAMESLRRAGEHIRNGKSIISFPEGTRSLKGKLSHFKRGTFVTAIEAQVPVVPIAITGTYEIWPPKQRRFRRGRKIRVKIGSPIPTRGLTQDDMETLRSKVRSEVSKMQSEIPTE